MSSQESPRKNGALGGPTIGSRRGPHPPTLRPGGRGDCPQLCSSFELLNLELMSLLLLTLKPFNYFSLELSSDLLNLQPFNYLTLILHLLLFTL